MEIAGGMIGHYLGYITWEDWEFDQGPEEYYQAVQMLKGEASDRNDLEPLLLGLDYILCHSEIDMADWIGNAWTDVGVREAVKYIRKVVYPDAPSLNCEEVKNVELIQMGQYDWWKMRTEQGLHPDFSKQQA